MPDALQMLKDDHHKVQDLFKEFEAAEQPAQKKRIVSDAIRELEIHTQLEEEIFYPAVRAEAHPEDDLMEEAEEEHHVVDVLIAELRRMQPTAVNFDAKFKVLAENVKHHIQEEESLMLPKAAELGAVRMNQLGDQMETRKLELERSYGARSAGRSRNGRPRTTTKTTARKRTTTATQRKSTRTTAARSTGTRTTPRTRRTTSATGGTRTRTRGTATGRTAARRTPAKRRQR